MRLEIGPTVTIPPMVKTEVFDETYLPAQGEFEKLLKEGITAAKNGERDEARDLLMQATEIDSLNEDAWMWLASISDYPEELVAFLNNVLTINPANARAKKWLAETESLLTTTGDDGQVKDQWTLSSEMPAGPLSHDTATCPFCSDENEANAPVCKTCHAALGLSDIEALLFNRNADRALIYDSITAMESEWDLEDLNDKELTALGIGKLTLRHFDEGQRYLHELLNREPNNVILAGQLNTIAIRVEEMRRQDEVAETKPKGKTILVVDDSATVRKLLTSKLEKSGHNVVCAVDGVDALAKIAENLPDMVFLDIAMPRMDGYDVCKEIRANPVSKGLPVVMISGKDGFFDKVRGKMAGASGYVTKPFGPDALIKALETHLAVDVPA